MYAVLLNFQIFRRLWFWNAIKNRSNDIICLLIIQIQMSRKSEQKSPGHYISKRPLRRWHWSTGNKRNLKRSAAHRGLSRFLLRYCGLSGPTMAIMVRNARPRGSTLAQMLASDRLGPKSDKPSSGCSFAFPWDAAGTTRQFKWWLNDTAKKLQIRRMLFLSAPFWGSLHLF